MTKQLLRYCSLGCIFLTTGIPLIVAYSMFFPFITGKAFIFRILVEIAFALWLLLVLRDKSYAPRFSWISVTVTVFAVVTLIADLAGLNPIRSLWSNFERMEGWVTIIHLWAYFIVTTSLFGAGEQGRRMWHNLMKTSLVVAGIVGVYGFFQLFGWAAIHQGSTRIDASLGNAAYMAVYMLIHVFIAFYFALVAWSKNFKPAVWGYTLLGLVYSYLVWETATRGTILGLFGGIMLALGIYAVFGKGESRTGRVISGSLIGVIILLGLGLFAAKNTPFVQGNETLNRMASISWDENKTQARGYVWPMAIQGVFESPKSAIIGVGQENFNYIFNSHYNPKMWGQEQWFDRAHSVYLDWLVAGGIIGVTLYLLLFIFSIIGVWKSQITFKEKSLLTGLFVAYAIHNIFVFDNLASYMLFFMLLGFVHTLTAGEALSWFMRKDIQSENAVVLRDYLFFPVIILGLIAVLYFINVRPIQANTRLITAMTYCSGQNTPSVQAYADALGLNEYVGNQEIREQLDSCSASVITSAAVSAQTKNDFFNFALTQIQKQVEATPNDARAYIIGGSFLDSISEWQTAQPLLEKANQLSPNKQSIISELGLNYLNTGKAKDAVDMLEKSYLSAPDDNNMKIAYASALIFIGNETKAKELIGNDPTFWNDPRIITIYVNSKQYNKALAIVNASIAKDPTNFQNYASLASIYYQSGDITSAVSLLEKMETKFPPYKDQIAQTVAQLKSIKK